MMSLTQGKKAPIDLEVNEGLIRHMVLNTIRMNVTKFRGDYGEIVIACDDSDYWRKKRFPYYKANRKKQRESSELDWPVIFESLNRIREELKEYFPYRVIRVSKAEADDVIGALVHRHGKVIGGDPILILSGDKDFQQLQTYSNVRQYDPVKKRWLDCPDPERFLIEHILRGDSGDGIPNFLSDDDTFVAPDKRQKKMYQVKVEQWVNQLIDKDEKDVLDKAQIRNWNRNRQLIDLSVVPADIQQQALDQYEQQADKGRSKLFNYFIKYDLKKLTESIQEF